MRKVTWVGKLRLDPDLRLKVFHIVTEDYSSYESVDEEEPDEPEKPKRLTSKPSESKLKRNKASKETKAPTKEPKKRASMGGGSSTKQNAGQSNLMNFFDKKA